jgi:CHAT domain-containing protein
LKDEEKLRNELTALEEMLQEEKSKPIEERDEQLIASMEEQIQNRHQAYRELLDSIELTNPELASLVSTPTTSVSETQALLSEDMILVSYYLTDESAFVFILGQDMFHVVELPASTEEITTAVENFRQLGLANLDNPIPRTLKDLYTWLVEPLEGYLKTSLVGVIPHQALHYLPFAALTDGERTFGNEHVLFQLPSISTFPYLKDKTARGVSTPLIFGDPQTENPDLPRLNFAVQEASLVADLFGVEPYIGEEASEVILKSEVGKAEMLHLAVHGGFKPGAPLFSRLWLSPGGEEDGRLNIYEVYGLDLDRTDLVVLSACETQLGELSAGDEVVGLNRAFLYGSSTVIASLWSVDDEATGALMESFYRHLLEGMGKAQALQAAQEEIRTDPDHPEWAHPYYWAAFVLNGDPGEVDSATKTLAEGEISVRGTLPIGLYILLVLGALVAVGGIAFFAKRKFRIDSADE